MKRRRNRWVVDFRDQTGRRRWESYRTREEAKNALSERIKQVRRGSYQPPADTPTFEEVAARWLESKRDHRVSSFAQWQAHLTLHLLPALGHLRLDRITVADVEALRDERRAARLKPQTVNKLLTTAAAVFKYAARHELTDRNPAQVAERCRLAAGEIETPEADAAAADGIDPSEVLSPDEAARLIGRAAPGFFQTYLLTAVLTGARVGELTALTWDDIDLAGASLTIRRSLSWAKPRGDTETRHRFYEPKTAASRRRLALPPELVQALRRWKLACPPGSLGLVFPTEDGRPKHRSVITHRGLRPALRKAKLRPVTLHSLRHTFASSLILAGAPVTEVAHLLGHSSPAVTMKVYAHWFRGAKSDAVANLARLVARGSKMVAVAGKGESRTAVTP